ncbi:MAG: 3-dehydroquinate synthase [Bacteroidales bacterium]|nr:3-dehydroquinate synthase [Bacteroidales bacterium]
MNIISNDCHVYASDSVSQDLARLLEGRDPAQVFLLVDEGSRRHCVSALGSQPNIPADHVITIAASDDHKDYTSALKIWEFLSSHGATRKALLINLGGGMPCDLGGFCAATFKRGVEFINIPTTLLAQVDASLGGKTGMNLGSLKNEIGVFAMASHVIICADFLRTLDRDNLLSGFAEMIKHALIHDKDELEALLNFDFENVDFAALHQKVGRSIMIKDFFVKADPKEKGLRKALNFGHTFGHAFETFAMRHQRPVLHGMAVAYGMVCEVMLSRDKAGLPAETANDIAKRIERLYGKPEVGMADAEELVELMRHDKKNETADINFTLLPQVGDVVVNQTASPAEIVKILKEYLAL